MYNMTVNDIIHRRNEWVRIAIYVGAHPDWADDIVHDFVIKLCEIQNREGNLDRFKNPRGKLNDVFVFRSLKNMTINEHKKNRRFTHHHRNIPVPTIPDAFDDVIRILENEHWYNREIFLEICMTDHSIRSLSRETKIPYNSMRLTYHKTINRIKQIFNHDEKTINGSRIR